MLLRHLHLLGLTEYTHASNLQKRFVAKLLAHKASLSASSPPDPTIITAEFHPVYTCGRREIGNVSREQIQYLTTDTPGVGTAEFHEALRGGQTTFHGPGQLVAYPILDLKRHNLTARCYVHFLESCVISTCARYGVTAQRTDNPGVWTDELHKICAVGVHLRRNVSSHGIGLNVSTEMAWLDRIVACGLEGKRTTSLELEGVNELKVEEAATVFVNTMAEGLGDVDGVVRIDENDVD